MIIDSACLFVIEEPSGDAEVQGARASSPDRPAELQSCAVESFMTPSMTAGHLNAPSSSAFHSITRPVPSQAISLIRSARRERNTIIVPANGSCPRASRASEASPSAPLRKSTASWQSGSALPRRSRSRSNGLESPDDRPHHTGSAPARTRTMTPAVRISIGAAAPREGTELAAQPPPARRSVGSPAHAPRDAS